jgi:hypothetical protein
LGTSGALSAGFVSPRVALGVPFALPFGALRDVSAIGVIRALVPGSEAGDPSAEHPATSQRAPNAVGIDRDE